MGVVLVRTNFNNKVGLGHLFRMKHLAKKLSKKNEVIFILDKKNTITEKIIDFQCIYLYVGKKKYTSQIQDAKKVQKETIKKKTDLIIVDDYRFTSVWQNFFFNKIKIAVFDDNNEVKHKCNILIDCKWDGPKTEQRYKNLIPKNSVKILGPQYAIIDKPKKITRSKNNQFNILFYLGGSGDFTKYHNLLKNIAKQFKNIHNLKFNIILGPLSKGHDRLRYIYKKNKKFNFISGNLSIKNILPSINLYLGVSSSIIYELNFLNIPSILFPTNTNQENSYQSLNDLGFFFFIKQKDLITKSEKVSKLLVSMSVQIKRIKKINKTKIKIDGKGPDRIAKFFNKIIENKKIKSNRVKKFSKKYFEKKDGFYSIKDWHINMYLSARNIKSNRENSVNKKFIENIDHYLWWFLEKREVFYYVRNKKVRVFLFHKVIKIKSKLFYYGGWFKDANKVMISDIISVVSRQTAKFKKLHWIAIIKKTNHFVFKLNSYLGFKKISFHPFFNFFYNKLNFNKYRLLIK